MHFESAYIHNPTVGYGVTANIAASHAAARGSIPRIRVLFVHEGINVGPFLPRIVASFLVFAPMAPGAPNGIGKCVTRVREQACSLSSR